MKKDFLIGLLIAFFLILLSFNFLLHCNQFHKKLIEQYTDNPYFIEVDKNVTKYITGFTSELNVDFNENEKLHMEDVRNLVLIQQFIFIVLIVLSFMLVYKKKINVNYFRKSSIMLFLIVLLSFIASLFFDIFFKLFHLILFPQGNWQFSSDSLMIQLYHQSFFKNFFIATIILSLLISIFIHLISNMKRKI